MKQMHCMKALISSTLLALTTSMFVTSCDKLPANGELDGMWQLMEIANESDTINTKENKVYYSFQLHLVQLDKYIHPGCKFMAHFEHRNDSMFFFDFKQKVDVDEPVTQPDTLLPFGLNALYEKFKVQELNNKRMVLTQEGKRLTFRKF